MPVWTAYDRELHVVEFRQTQGRAYEIFLGHILD
jgi:hypothetical protein